MDSSKRWSFNKVDGWKVLRLTGVAAVGGAAAYLLTALVGLDLFPNTNVDELLITAAIIPAVEALRRWATNYS